MDIFQSIYNDNYDEIKEYLENDGDVNKKDESGYSILNVAGLMGKKKIVKLLKKHGANTDVFTEVAIGNIKTVSEYLNNGFDVNTFNKHGHQILMIAAHQGHIEIVKMLIKKGANINAKHKYSGNTALIGAAFQGQKAMVEYLIKEKADINIKNNEGKTALQIALLQGNNEIVDLLKSAGAK